MKRILIFSLNYHPFVGGAEVAIREITNRISTDEYEFHLIAYRFDATLPKTERIGNVTVHRIGVGKRSMTVAESFGPLVYLGKVLYIPLAAFTAYRLHQRLRFHALWSMMVYMVFPVVLLRLLGVRLPYLVTLQEGDPFEHVFSRSHIRLVGPLLFSGIRGASSVQAISTFLADWARRCGYTGGVDVVPNGVDVSRFAGVTRVPGDGLRLVSASRLVAKNGIDTVIRALPLLPNDVTFTVYGDGPLKTEYEALASSLGVRARVTFAGSVPHGALAEAFAAADIFVRPSRSEGMGNAFIEAMAAGLPVIGTPVGGITDFLTDAREHPETATGWLVAPDAPEEVAAAVNHIRSSSETVKRVTETARRMVTEKYDWSLIARTMREIFHRLTA